MNKQGVVRTIVQRGGEHQQKSLQSASTEEPAEHDDLVDTLPPQKGFTFKGKTSSKVCYVGRNINIEKCQVFLSLPGKWQPLVLSSDKLNKHTLIYSIVV